MRDKFLLSIINPENLKYYDFQYSNETLKPITKDYKISICTNSMDRAYDIKKTYEKNILDNIDYKNIEFVLLNYNSKDDLDDYVKKDLMKYIDKGILNYYKTTEPKFYSMTHSRNVAFKLATGDIVNNVDADQFTNKGFAEHINLLANQRHKRTVFVKSKQKNRGRLGFFKKEFLWLGGYNEELEGYGFDDEDLVARAYNAGLVLSKFTGKYCRITDDHKRHVGKNYKEIDWKYTQRKNTLISILNLKYNRLRANQGKHWGQATLIKNFTEKVSV